jgi:hypothetical protein
MELVTVNIIICRTKYGRNQTMSAGPGPGGGGGAGSILCNNGFIFKLRETGYLDLTIIKGTPKHDNVHR